MKPELSELLQPVPQVELDAFITAVLQFERAALRRADVSGEIGEQLVARLLGAQLRRAQHAKDWDAWSDALGRISIKTRQVGLDGRTRKGVDMDGEYDTFVLCYLDKAYRPYLVQVLSQAEANAARAPYKGKVSISTVLAHGKRVLGEGRPWPPSEM